MFKAKVNGQDGTSGMCRGTASKAALNTAFGGLSILIGFSLVGIRPVDAASIQLGDFTITLQSTLGYTLGLRTAPVDNTPALNYSGNNFDINSDDGDKNLKSGVMADRFQTLEQLGIIDGDYGFRASALAFIDTVYLQHSQNNSPNTFNSYDIGPQGFPSATVANEGRKFEPLAAFIYGAENFDNGNQRLSWQVGRQTITWGESLFSLDGISGLQAPVDAYQGELLPNPQAQALFLPTGAASVSYAFGNGITVDAYEQFEYEPDILPGVGSYFSPNDYVGPGAQRILESPIDEGALSIYRGPDVRPPNGLDQFGFAAHDALGNYQFGLYFVRGIPKGPGVYTHAPAFFTPGPGNGLQIGEYNLYYAQPVNAVAVSVSSLLFGANVAAEISDRINQPLISQPLYTSVNPPGYSDLLYATGNVVDGQFSALYVSPPLPLMPNGGTFEGELTLNEVTAITKNRPVLLRGNTSEGGSFEAVWKPSWFPLSDVEVDAPIGWTTTFLGDSQYDSTAAGDSTYDVGIDAVYKSNLTIGINYQRYAGPPNRQGNLDKDFATFYVQRTF